MRLPWQKESVEVRKNSLKDLMSVGNSSTGSFESPVSERSKVSKLRKEVKKSDDGSSSEDRSPLMLPKKTSIDILKSDKPSSSLDVPKVSKHRRKSIDVASLSESGMKNIHPASNLVSSDALPIPSPIANIQPASATGSATIQVTTPDDKKEKEKKKKEKKPKGLGPKAPKMCKDGKVRRVVSFNEFIERLMPNGKIENGQINVHECAKGETPYHKRGKEEYKMKKALLRAARIANGENMSDEDILEGEEEREPLPAFNLTVSSEDDAQIEDSNTMDLTKHSINFLGPIPQNQVLNNNGLNISLQSFSISRYSPDIKGILVIGNSHKILPASDESHFLKTDINIFFDDWDTKQSVSADKMDPGVLNMLLRTNPIADPLKDNNMYQLFKNQNEIEERVGFLFTIPLEELFLPSLYAMLNDMGMEPDQPTFEVEGVVILVINIYKSTVLFRGRSLEVIDAKDKLIDQTLDKLESLTLKNSLSNEKLGSLEQDSFSDMYNSEIQITRSSAAEDPRNISAPELPKIQESSPNDSSNSSQEVSASLDALPIWNLKDSTMNSPTGSKDSTSKSPDSKSPNAKQRSPRNSGSALALDDQLVLSARFEIGFTVEKSPDGGIKSFDLLHVGYQKPK